jgi:hypothetical protein
MPISTLAEDEYDSFPDADDDWSETFPDGWIPLLDISDRCVLTGKTLAYKCSAPTGWVLLEAREYLGGISDVPIYGCGFVNNRRTVATYLSKMMYNVSPLAAVGSWCVVTAAPPENN